jgi:hypothetical protein
VRLRSNGACDKIVRPDCPSRGFAAVLSAALIGPINFTYSCLLFEIGFARFPPASAVHVPTLLPKLTCVRARASSCA